MDIVASDLDIGIEINPVVENVDKALEPEVHDPDISFHPLFKVVELNKSEKEVKARSLVLTTLLLETLLISLLSYPLHHMLEQ